MGKSITDLSSVTRVGLDLAKHVFQVHGVDAPGDVVFNKAIKRDKLLAFFAALPQCLVGLEACGSVSVTPTPRSARALSTIRSTA